MANTELFLRKYQLTIGRPGQQGKLWQDLQMTFNIEKTNDSTPNKLELTIFNLNDDSRGFISEKGMFILLDAGYELETGLIFKGSIEQVTHEKQGAEWVSKIESKDGIKNLRGKTSNKSFDSGVTLKQVIDQLAADLGYTLGSIKNIPTVVYNSGRVLSGSTKAELDEITKSNNLKWSVQDEVLHIAGVNQSHDTQVILLNKSSGLIGSPEKTEKGYKFVSLLRHGLNPGDKIKVESDIVTGAFLVKNLNHNGSYTGSEWFTEIEGQQI